MKLPYVLIVEFTVDPEHATEFSRLVIENAEASRQQEPGCRIFDVCRDVSRRNSFLLYEVYDNEDSFQDHLKTDHFKEFDRRVAPWTINKTARVLERESP